LTTETLDDALGLARNAKGEPLKESTKADIRSLVDDPNPAGWEKCSTVILRGGEDVETVTLWKAVCEVDPAFPASTSHDDAGNRIWEQIPTARTIRRAIRWAVGTEEPAVGVIEMPDATASANGAATVDPWTEIDLDPDRKAELQKWFAMFQAQHPAAPRGLLLFGPPGTGKTLLARTLARAAGAQFIATTISDLKAPHVGGTGERIRQLWRRARQNARAIIFVDDCEGIFGAREDVDNDSFNREALQEFLAQWEGVLDNSRHVWVIGATNKRERIDHAMVSRFGAEFAFGLPNAEMRRSILQREMKRCWVEYAAVDEVVAQTNGFSGRDLRTLAESVARDSFSETTKACEPTEAIFDKHIAAIRKRGNIGIAKRSTWENLILPDEIKSDLRIMCEMLRRSEEMKGLSIELPRGLLLSGPAGTGKTEIARTLANESGLNFIGTKSTDFVGGYSGWSGQMTKSIFARARAESPAILFIDEIDKIAPKPEGVGGGHGFTIEVVRALVEEMEGIAEHEGHVFVIGATNRIEAVDSTIRSRLGKVITVPLPDTAQREALLRSRLTDATVDFDLRSGLREIAEATAGWSGRDLITLIGGAQRRAILRLLNGETAEVVLSLADFRENLNVLAREPKRRRWWPFMAIFASAMLLFGLGRAGIAAVPASVTDAAKKEGTVVWYTSVDAKTLTPLVQRFDQSHPGIALQTLQITSNLIPARIITEQRGGKFNADVANGDVVPMAQLAAAGALQVYHPADPGKFVKGANDPNGLWSCLYFDTTVLAWNVKKLQADGLKPPTSVADLARPEWRGKIGLNATAYNWYQGLTEIDPNAKDLLTKIIANHPLLTQGHTNTMTQLESGEFDVTPTVYGYLADKEHRAGLGIDFINPKPLIVGLTPVAFIKNAPHPNAARVLLDWLLSKDGQNALVELSGRPSARIDVENNPNVFNTRMQLHVIKTPDPSEYNALVSQYNKILGVNN